MLEYFISADIFIKKIQNFDEIIKKKALYLATNRTKENQFNNIKFVLLLNNISVNDKKIDDLVLNFKNIWENLTSDERSNYQDYLRLLLNKFLSLPN